MRATARAITGLLAATAAALPAQAGAEPASGPHGTIDQQLTTTEPSSPSGSHFTGRYHAANDPEGDPPYMRRMTFYPHPGTRYDTSVPKRCRATDAELQVRGPSACPPGSRIGGGTGTAKAMGQVNTVKIDVFNNTGQIVMVISTPGVYTVSRGRFGADGSQTFESPTCYPNVSVAGCPVDNALQTGSDVSFAPYVRTVDGEKRSYLTTPPACPETGYWETPVRFWWADGSGETIVTRQPCTPAS